MLVVPALVVVLLAVTATAAVALAALTRVLAHRWRRRPLRLPAPARTAPAWQADDLAPLLRAAALTSPDAVPAPAVPAPRSAGASDDRGARVPT